MTLKFFGFAQDMYIEPSTQLIFFATCISF
jgi:hypothetical protein